MVKPAIKYVSLAEPSGYGIAARDYLLALMDAGQAVSWAPLVFTGQGYAPWNEVPDGEVAVRKLLEGAGNERRLHECLGAVLEHDLVLLHCVPEYWCALAESGCGNIGYTAWETDRPPAHWPPMLNAMNRVQVPSRFCREVFMDAGVTVPIDVVPHVVTDPGVTEPGAGQLFRERFGIPAGNHVFYTINTWTPRKCLWRLLHAYLLAFDAGDAVTLVMKTSETGVRHERSRERLPTQGLVGDLVANYPDPAHVCLINREMDEGGIAGLHAAGDCYLSLSRGEGWGLGAAAAAAHGHPVIVTGWGGQLDFLPADLAYHVDYRLVPVQDALGSGSYGGDQRWADFELDHAIELMRWVSMEGDVSRNRGARLREFVLSRFAPPTVSAGMMESLDAARS